MAEQNEIVQINVRAPERIRNAVTELAKLARADQYADVQELLLRVAHVDPSDVYQAQGEREQLIKERDEAKAEIERLTAAGAIEIEPLRSAVSEAQSRAAAAEAQSVERAARVRSLEAEVDRLRAVEIEAASLNAMISAARDSLQRTEARLDIEANKASASAQRETAVRTVLNIFFDWRRDHPVRAALAGVPRLRVPKELRADGSASSTSKQPGLSKRPGSAQPPKKPSSRQASSKGSGQPKR
jgi:chromosome segregation ATPase